jgi:hypothetical protein
MSGCQPWAPARTCVEPPSLRSSGKTLARLTATEPVNDCERLDSNNY